MLLSRLRPRRPFGRVTPPVPCSAPVGSCLGRLWWSRSISSSVVVLPAAAVSPAPVSFPRIPFPRRARRGAVSGLPLLPPVMFRLNSLEDPLVHLSGHQAHPFRKTQCFLNSIGNIDQEISCLDDLMVEIWWFTFIYQLFICHVSQVFSSWEHQGTHLLLPLAPRTSK